VPLYPRLAPWAVFFRRFAAFADPQASSGNSRISKCQATLSQAQHDPDQRVGKCRLPGRAVFGIFQVRGEADWFGSGWRRRPVHDHSSTDSTKGFIDSGQGGIMFFRPFPGLVRRLRLMTHGLRRGLHSFAPSGLVRDVCRSPTAYAVVCILVLLRSCGLRSVSGLGLISRWLVTVVTDSQGFCSKQWARHILVAGDNGSAVRQPRSGGRVQPTA
jgi:hypothetical protein